LLETEFFHAVFIRSDGSALNTYTILFDSIRGINGNLVIGLVAVFDTEIEIFNVQFQIRKYQFIFDKLPDESSSTTGLATLIFCVMSAVEFKNNGQN
jgi:hypothetical protein